jgi:hypothetical protein
MTEKGTPDRLSDQNGRCEHPREALAATFGLRTLPWCSLCGRQMCHTCLAVHDRDKPHAFDEQAAK